MAEKKEKGEWLLRRLSTVFASAGNLNLKVWGISVSLKSSLFITPQRKIIL